MPKCGGAECIGTRLLSLSTIADAKISNPPWVNFQSAGWVSFQSAPTVLTDIYNSSRTLRMLKDINATELAAHASHATYTSISTAKNFLKWLNWAGYLDVTIPAQPGRQARYRLAYGMYTGPLPPVIQRSGQLFDPNVGTVVYVLPSKRSNHEL